MTERPPRSPNFMRFIITGALIGLVIGIFLGLREPGGPSYHPEMTYDNGASMAFLGVLGAFFGAGIGAVAALLLDRTGRGDRTGHTDHTERSSGRQG